MTNRSTWQVDRLAIFRSCTRSLPGKQLPDGHRLQFAASDDLLAIIARTIDAERECCRFLRFRVTVEPDGGPVALELTGPPGTREFISGLLEA